MQKIPAKEVATDREVFGASDLDQSLKEIKGKKFMDYVNVKDFGAQGDGITDDTEIFKEIFNNLNNGDNLLIPKGTYIVNDLFIKNLENINIVCRGILKRQDDLPSHTETTSTLTIEDCKNIKINEINFDGNHYNNNCVVGGTTYNHDGYQQEHRHSLIIKNCEDVIIEKILGLNPSGDVLYINGSKTKNINVKNIIGKSKDNNDNFVALGRNTMSIIEGKDIYIGNLLSYYVGHEKMPGGLDIEPNSGQKTLNINVNNLIVYSESMSGLGITTKYGNGENIKNVFINNAYIENTVINTNRNVVITGCTNVKINNLTIIGSEETYSLHIGIAGESQPVYNLIINNLYEKTTKYAIIADNLHGGYIKGNFENTCGNFLRLYTVKDFDFEITGTMINSNPDSTVILIYLYTGSDNTLDNLKLKGDISYTKIGEFGDRAVSCNASNSSQIINCDFSNLITDGWDNNDFIGPIDHVRKHNTTKLNDNGLTSDRPSSPNKGFNYYDRDLNQPIWWNGNDWIDATGTVV
jgi:hypothetical protein